ncbi:MAG TPA: phosphoribosylamine--glycine ligase [Halanaerobiales bacterium]|nr:phosphoribosylamine--glycine ligase [Halanaerobiales bacterium]
MENILIVGSGGREHALCKKLKESSRVEKIYVLPGNAGTSDIAENVDIDPLNFKEITDFAKAKEIDMTFVGPEKPLVEGIVDYFNEEGLKIFGPNKQAARLEGSKVYAKRVMEDCGIPTAKFSTFENSDEALNFIKDCDFPVVVKAEGLAAGKGVLIVENQQEAEAAITKIMEDRYFGEAGKRVLIEEFLKGEEATIMVFSDGKTYYPMVSAQDHKQVGEGDTGPNTGGMGAYAPTPLVDEKVKNKVDKQIITPLFTYLNNHGIEFKGVLFIGLMINKGQPKVLEFNVRFGDPEAQVVLPLLENDLVEIADKIDEEKLNEINLKWQDKKTMAVIMASGGYPIDYDKGKKINGLEKFSANSNPYIIQAGTKYVDNEIYTDGGRVLALVSVGDTYQEVYDLCYEKISAIDFEKAYYRKDIGRRIKGVKLLKDE